MFIQDNSLEAMKSARAMEQTHVPSVGQRSKKARKSLKFNAKSTVPFRCAVYKPCPSRGRCLRDFSNFIWLSCIVNKSQLGALHVQILYGAQLASKVDEDFRG